MGTEAQMDMDWAGTDFGDGAAGGAGIAGSAADVAAAQDSRGAAGAAYFTDEEILGIEPVGADSRLPRSVIPSGARNRSLIAHDSDDATAQRDSSVNSSPRNDRAIDVEDEMALRGDGEELGHKGAQAEAYATEMPEWMAAAAADPRNAAAATELWREHEEFRAAFASPDEARTFVQEARAAAVEARAVAEEARAIKELLPGGVKDIVSLREATQSVERIDAALFSGDARAQADVVAEMARVNPAAFRSMFAEAARVMAGLGGKAAAGGGDGDAAVARLFRGGDLDAGAAQRGSEGRNSGTSGDGRLTAPTLREEREGWGTRQNRNPVADRASQGGVTTDPTLRTNREGWATPQNQDLNQNRRQDAGTTNSSNANHETPFAEAHGKQIANHDSRVNLRDSSGQANYGFDAAAYAAFERTTNETVARDVRGSIADTLARVMPEGVAEGAARRMGEDIFGEVHRALAGDRALSEQVASVLRGGPPSPENGFGGLRASAANAVRFGAEEQARVAALVAGRAKQLVPSVARRVIGEWTSSVLSTARSKAARQAAAAARVDIAAPGGSSDTMPLRAMSAREVNYASMSDEQILWM